MTIDKENILSLWAVFLVLFLGVPAAAHAQAYESIIEDDRNDMLFLEDGAVLEVTAGGYVGYIGYRKTAIYYFTASGCKVWIEGKHRFSCDLLREPDYNREIAAEIAWLSETSSDGSVLVFDDGSVFEVLYQGYATSLWLPDEVLILDDSRMIHLSSGDEIIAVMRLR